MSVVVVPFGEEHLDAAAALLAQRHRADRAREPDLPARFEEAAATRDALRAALARDGTG